MEMFDAIEARDDTRENFLGWVLCGILAVACCLATATTCGATQPDDGWRVLKRGVFINEKNMAFLTDTVTSVWVKIIPDKGSTLFSLALERLRDAGTAFRSFAYTTFLAEIDCTGNRHRELSVLFYSRDKNILHATNRKNAPWEAIPDGSSMSAVRERVCGSTSTPESS